MKFEVIGTKTILEPVDPDVIEAYLGQPDIYKHVGDGAGHYMHDPESARGRKRDQGGDLNDGGTG